ncbi:hypothetical protein ABBQ38_012674 [Trebouxia sp. C0009 RCD-2024]
MVFRLCGPATHALPPFCDIPIELRDTLRGQYELLNGGYEFDGGTEISPLSTEQIHKVTDKALKAGYTSLVVSGVFSPVNSSQEEAAADIINKHVAVHYAGLGLPGALYLTSNDGTLMSSGQAQRLPLHTFQSGPVNSLRGAAKLSGLTDGIVVDIGGTTTDVGVLQHGFPRPASREALLAGVRINQRVPDILSIGLGGGSVVRWKSGTCTVGPDSIASQLTSRALVFGGSVCTATDVAVRLGKLSLGQPHLTSGLSTSDAQQAWDTMQSMLTQCIDQVKTSAEAMPVIVVGGGAGLCGDALEGAACIVKPPHADIANAVGAAIPQVSGTVDGVFQMGSEGQKRQACLAEAQASAHAKAVQAGADPSTCKARPHLAPPPPPLSPPSPSPTSFPSLPLPPPSAPPASGPGPLMTCTHVMALDEIPLAYLPGGVVRLHVKVVGDLQIAAPPTKQWAPQNESDLQKPHQPAEQQQDAQQHQRSPQQQPRAPGTPQQQTNPGKILDNHPQQTLAPITQTPLTPISHPSLTPVNQTFLAASITSPASLAHTASGGSHGELNAAADLASLSPHELSQSGGSKGATTAEWVITKDHVEALAIGCGILGSGGGGSPYRAKLKLLQRLKEGAKIRVVPCSAVPDDAYVVDASYMGAPTVSIEKLDSSQAEAAAHAVLKAVGKEAFAIVAGEIGGGNGLEALNVAASMNLPVVDADFMGRAFPELQMMTTAIYGVPVAPAALADEKGNTVVVQTVANIHSLEHILRPVCTAMGCSAGFASAPVSGKQLRAVAIQGSLSLALALGRAVQQAQHSKADPVAAAATAGNGNLIFKGKVTDIERSTTDGFAKGVLRLSGLDHWCGQQADIHFQNENLQLRIDGKVAAIVPDLICCLDIHSGHSVATEELCYGLRLSVVRLPANTKLLTPEVLEIIGPQAFGLEDPHLTSLQNSRTAARMISHYS